MVRLSIFQFCLLIGSLLHGQGLVKDTQALQMLNDTKALYESYESYELDFVLDIQQGNATTDSKKGKIIQSGLSYYMETEDQAMYIDGKSSWLHLKSSNEVQINDFDEEESFDILSPTSILNEFTEEDYDYMISNISTEDGKKITDIDLKPLDGDADFSKIRFTFASANQDLLRINVFSKDGSRYTLTINNLEKNKQYDQSVFSFDKTKYPDVYIEDLRID